MWNVQQYCKKYGMRKVSFTQTYPELVSDSQSILVPADFSWINMITGKKQGLRAISFLQVLWHGYIGLTYPQRKCWTPKLRKEVLFVIWLSKTSVFIHGFVNMVYPLQWGTPHLFFLYFPGRRVDLSSTSRPSEF